MMPSVYSFFWHFLRRIMIFSFQSRNQRIGFENNSIYFFPLAPQRTFSFVFIFLIEFLLCAKCLTDLISLNSSAAALWDQASLFFKWRPWDQGRLFHLPEATFHLRGKVEAASGQSCLVLSDLASVSASLYFLWPFLSQCFLSLPHSFGKCHLLGLTTNKHSRVGSP